MATVKFIIRSKDREKRNEPALIFAQYTHRIGKDYSSVLFSTGKKIEPKFWNKDKGRVKTHEKADSLNKFLNQFDSKLINVATDLQNKEIEPIPARVKDAFKEVEKAKLPEADLTRSIISQWRDYLNSRKNSVKALTHSNQRNSLEALESFLQAQKIESLRPESFTIKHLTKFQDYLNEKLASNTVAKRLKHFKAFLKYYQELVGQTGLNLAKIKYKETEGVKIYLTEEELEIFQDAPVKDITSVQVRRGGKVETVYVNLEQVRDLFILQCNTGLRISDLKRVDQNIKGNKIVITTKKTGVNIEIPISPTVRAILEKYKYQLPQISEQKINDGIKAIYKICFPKNKIQVRKGNDFETIHKWELISTHDAIRTFITLSAERGMTVSAISKITGKTIPVLLKHYLSQSQKVADLEMEKAWGASPLRIAK
jgi:integrase